MQQEALDQNCFRGADLPTFKPNVMKIGSPGGTAIKEPPSRASKFAQCFAAVISATAHVTFMKAQCERPTM
jgi:hypothetical protein